MKFAVYTRKDLLAIARQLQDAIDDLKKAKDMMSEDIDDNNIRYMTTDTDKAIERIERLRDEYTSEYTRRMLDLMK